LDIRDIMRLSPVIPVITLETPEQVLPLAEALLQGGLLVLEITLRTPAALPGITTLRKHFPEAIIGAGTVINQAAVDAAANSGAHFLVSPGCTPALLQAAGDSGLPLLPGACTPSEIMALLERGITAMKFFPAEQAGGAAMLKALAAPLPQALFCPTGCISLEKAQQYLSLPNVACVGGSWMLKPEWLQQGRWQEVKAQARNAFLLGKRA
jgi:2-dehydro-3-deoxyphosphogluconate aldolase / (4S)-4-hydroxy-2-oxoglutarate aldolase